MLMLPDSHSLQDATSKMVALTQFQADQVRVADDDFSQEIIRQEFQASKVENSEAVGAIG